MTLITICSQPEAASTTVSEEIFEREWAIALLDRVMERLRAEYADKQRMPHFETLKLYLAGSPKARPIAIARSRSRPRLAIAAATALLLAALGAGGAWLINRVEEMAVL